MTPLLPARCHAHNAFNTFTACNAVRSAFARRHFSAATGEEKLKFKSSNQIHTVRGPVRISEIQQYMFKSKQTPSIFRQQTRKSGAYKDEAVVIPALAKWFEDSNAPGRRGKLSPYLNRHLTTMLPYELILWSPDLSSRENSNVAAFLSWLSTQSDPLYQNVRSLLERELAYHLASDPSGPSPKEQRAPQPRPIFLHFEAPLALLAAGVRFNTAQPSADLRFTELYVAQAPISSLPEQLQADVPTPAIVTMASRKSVYGSSIWMGLEPTFTPWHRDPNPNLFCQLYGHKVVRMSAPHVGLDLFHRVQAKLEKSGSSRIRGAEMMQGPERVAMHDAVWTPELPRHVFEVVVKPSDVLFIPEGWWHSVKSANPDSDPRGGLNASVNWWFRFATMDGGRSDHLYTNREGESGGPVSANREGDSVEGHSTKLEGAALEPPRRKEPPKVERRRNLGGKPVSTL